MISPLEGEMAGRPEGVFAPSFTIATPRFRSGHFKELCPEAVGKAGGLWFARFSIYMRPEGRPFGVLPHLGDGICAATPSVEARTYGLITQQHYRSATDPAPPPAPDTRCAPGFPRKRWRDHKGGWGGGDK